MLKNNDFRTTFSSLTHLVNKENYAIRAFRVKRKPLDRITRTRAFRAAIASNTKALNALAGGMKPAFHPIISPEWITAGEQWCKWAQGPLKSKI